MKEGLLRIRIIIYLSSLLCSFRLFHVNRFTNLLSNSDHHFFCISWRLQVSFGTSSSFHLGIVFLERTQQMTAHSEFFAGSVLKLNFSHPVAVTHITWSVPANHCAALCCWSIPKSLALTMTPIHVFNTSGLLSGSSEGGVPVTIYLFILG